MPTKENDLKYKLYNRICDGYKERLISWSKQNIIAVSTLIKSIDNNKKIHYIPSIHIFKEIVALEKFLNINKSKTDLSGYSRIGKSSYFHKSEIIHLSWSDDGNYLCSIDKDGCICIWESKNFINEWVIWYHSNFKIPISCFTWIHSYDKFNIEPKSEYKYINNPIGCQNINNIGFAILTNEGELTIVTRNENDIANKNIIKFKEFNKQKVIIRSSCYVSNVDNTLSYVIYYSNDSSKYIQLFNVPIEDDFPNKSNKYNLKPMLKIDSIQNINKDYKLLDIQLLNEKKMILTFGINKDKEFSGYICLFELSDEIDNQNSSDDMLSSKKTWNLVKSFAYERTFPVYINIVTNSFNKQALVIKYENGKSELRDCETLKTVSYYDWIFTNTLPVIDNKLIEALKSYNTKANIRFKRNSEEESSQKKKKLKDSMDQDQEFKLNPNLDIFSSSLWGDFVSKMDYIYNENDGNETNKNDSSYYYTSEIILSPNGMISVSFDRAFNDNKFKIKEGSNILDLLLSWGDKELITKKYESKFIVDFYSDGQYYNLINTLVAQLVISILNKNDYDDMIYFLMKIKKHFTNKDLFGDLLVCFFNEYNKSVTLLNNDIINDFPRDESTTMAIEGQPFIVSMVFNRSLSSRDIQFLNNDIYIQLNYIGQSFMNHFVYPWKINKYLDKPILKIEEEFENYCEIKKECFHYNAPMAHWIIELCKHILRHLYIWYNITCHKRNRAEILNGNEIIDEFFNEPNYIPLILFSNSRKMLIRLINYVNLYGINVYINYENNLTKDKKQEEHEGLTIDEENYYLCEFNNILLKNKMDLNEFNKMLYEIDTRLKPLEKKNDLEYQISEIKEFIYNSTIPDYLNSFVKNDLKELFNTHIQKIFISDNLSDAYTNLFSQVENSCIEHEKVSNMIDGLIYKNFAGLKLYGIGFSMKNSNKKIENINFEEPKQINTNLNNYQINSLPNTFFSDIVSLNEVNINESPNFYVYNSRINKTKIVTILENNISKQYDILSKATLQSAIGIRQCERCFHFSEIPHIEDFGGLPLIKPLNSLSTTKKITMPSVGGENLNSGLGIFIFQGKAAWYKKHGSNCICGGRWRKW
ncbi:hypothetical protein H8356DRAFT_1058605 [Neocallimastix lanati (nom. inval.)]|nr:hypothetical protein H8356DRAFT_1058605 [Neocallimastix sp. JGI-2020a]